MKMKGQWRLPLLLGLAFLARTGSERCGPKGQKVWLIQAGDDYGTYDFLTEDGSRTGYAEAIILEVCKAAGIRCQTVFAPYSICLQSPEPVTTKHILLGQGLEDGSVDACPGYFPTYERYDVALFSDGFFADVPYFMWYLGSPPAGAIGSLRVGFIVGPPGDEICITRYLTRISAGGIPTFVPYGSWTDALDDLGNNQIDLLWDTVRDSVLSKHPDVPNLRIYDTDNNGDSSMDDRGNNEMCSLAPAGIHTRKDNEELIWAFNRGLQIIIRNGVLRSICDDPKWNPLTPTSEHRAWCIRW